MDDAQTVVVLASLRVRLLTSPPPALLCRFRGDQRNTSLTVPSDQPSTIMDVANHGASIVGLSFLLKHLAPSWSNGQLKVSVVRGILRISIYMNVNAVL